MLKKIITFYTIRDTTHLVMFPLGLGMLLIVMSIVLSGIGYFGHRLGGFFFPSAFFVWGFMGIPMIIRKEMPWLITIKGWLAVLEGVVLVVTCWGVAIGLTCIMLNAR